VTEALKSFKIPFPDWLVTFKNATMEPLAYIHLACSYEASDVLDLITDQSKIQDAPQQNGKKLYHRIWMSLLSLLATSTVLGMSTQAQAQLTQGSRGSDVTQLQQQLRELGYFNRPSTGNFGPLTKQAVIRFQQDEGLTPNGVVETRTKTALQRRLGRSESESETPATPAAPATSATPEPVRRTTLRRGSSGSDVEALQKLLAAAGVYNGTTTGKFDAKTFTAVRRFQRNNRLIVDGIVGARTWSTLLDNNGTTASGPFNKEPFTDGEPSLSPNTPSNEEQVTASGLQQGSRGAQVRELQQRLRELGYFNGRSTGNFGPLTKAAVIQLQQDSGLTANGVVDESTKAALQKKTGSANNLSVTELQQRLKEKGFYSGPIDGALSEQTKAAIQAAQRAYGVSEDDILKARF
jgi:peptidoglycan hydrolase-like protein with peptidoglycan-binding domain